MENYIVFLIFHWMHCIHSTLYFCIDFKIVPQRHGQLIMVWWFGRNYSKHRVITTPKCKLICHRWKRTNIEKISSNYFFFAVGEHAKRCPGEPSRRTRYGPSVSELYSVPGGRKRFSDKSKNAITAALRPIILMEWGLGAASKWSLPKIAQIHKPQITNQISKMHKYTNAPIRRICAFVSGKFVISWYRQPPLYHPSQIHKSQIHKSQIHKSWKSSYVV